MATTTTIVGSGTYTYEAHEDWAKLPDGWAMPAAAVTVDSQDRVTPYMTFETPPRHVYKPDDVVGLTHWMGSSLPWNASG